MFRRKFEYEDEKQPLPTIWAVVIAIAVVAAMIFGVMKFADWIEAEDMEWQYNNYTEKVL